MKILLLIPTFNERGNITALIRELLMLEQFFKILVIDDRSPDGTADEVLKHFGHMERVSLIQREQKLGLGTAYSEGFRFAIASGFSAVISMDADFSHDPKRVPNLVEAAFGAEIVIGSRYVSGGSVVNWNLGRRWLSRIANFMAQELLRLNVKDCTSGFRLYHCSTLRDLAFETIQADGYSYLVEILFRAKRHGMTIREVPIVFTERRHGKSKISRKEIFKAITTLLRLRGTKIVASSTQKGALP